MGVSPALRQQGNMSLRAPHEPAAATVQNGLSIERKTMAISIVLTVFAPNASVLKWRYVRAAEHGTRSLGTAADLTLGDCSKVYSQRQSCSTIATRRDVRREEKGSSSGGSPDRSLCPHRGVARLLFGRERSVPAGRRLRVETLDPAHHGPGQTPRHRSGWLLLYNLGGGSGES